MDDGKHWVITSPLADWPGEILLPRPADFNRPMWQTWRDAFNRAPRQDLGIFHHFCYAGLEFIKAHGSWEMEIPLEEVAGWEEDGEAERTKLANWLGNSIQAYMLGQIIDPKK